MKIRLASTIGALVLLAGCSDGPAESEIADASQLSEELEARAVEIEDRADQAVIAVEEEAQEELAALNAEAAAAAEDVAATPSDDQAADEGQQVER